jgi:hypothetical protein
MKRSGSSVLDSSGTSKPPGAISVAGVGTFSWVSNGNNPSWSGPSLRLTGSGPDRNGGGITFSPAVLAPSVTSGQVTFAAYVKFNSALGGYTTIIDTTPRDFSLWLTSGGWQALTNSLFPATCFPSAPTLGVWHYLQVSQDNTNIRVFLDEVLVCSRLGAPSNPLNSPALALTVGLLNPSGGGDSLPSNYELQDIRIYDVAFATSLVPPFNGYE